MLAVVANAGNHQADIAALEVGPVALGFETEHPGAGLPAIADLTTDGAAGRVMAALGTRTAGRLVKSQHLRLEPQPPLIPM